MLGLRSAGRQFATALRALIVATIVLGSGLPAGHHRGVAGRDAGAGGRLARARVERRRRGLRAHRPVVRRRGRQRAAAVLPGPPVGRGLRRGGLRGFEPRAREPGPRRHDRGDRIAAVAASDGVAPDRGARRRGHGFGVGPRSAHQPRVRSRAGGTRRRGARAGAERCAQRSSTRTRRVACLDSSASPPSTCSRSTSRSTR